MLIIQGRKAFFEGFAFELRAIADRLMDLSRRIRAAGDAE